MGATSESDSLVGRIMGGRILPLLLIIVFLFAGFLGWIYWNRFEQIFALQGEIAELKKRRENLIEDISDLRAKRNRRNDIDYIEKLAKEELGLVYPSSKSKEKG